MGKTLMRNGSPLFELVERGSRTITSAILSQELLADDSATFKVESKNVLDIKINDYIIIDGATYRINQIPSFIKNNESNYIYDLKFEGLLFDLKRCKFFNADAAGYKTELEFPLIGNLELFLTAIRNNMHRFSVDWEIGNFPANTETKSLTFSSDSCLSALQRICQEYKIEFWVKQENGKFKIHTGAFGATLPITLEYGKGKGLYSLSRKSVNENDLVSRLYVNGGSTNIPNEYRGFSKNLLLPNADYLEDTALISEIGLIEGSLTLDEIYPKRTGVISALGSTKFKFVDSSMDFDLNEKEADGITTKYLIAGTTAKIHFNTGNLAGYQFEIKKGGYDHSTKTFEIIPFTNEQGQKFPDDTKEAFQFSVGDEYKILDIYMPQSYITNAENELLAKATEQFNLLKQPKVSYDLKTDPEFIKSLQTPIQIGDMVNVKDSALGIDKVLRVQKVSKNLITDEVESIEIADAYEVNFASKLLLDVREIKNVVNITKLGEINYSKLGLKTTEELKNLVFDTDGYFDPENIKPFSIETNMLSVGSRSQQISLSSIFRVNQDGNPNKIDVTAGQLFSQTLDKTWNVSALVTNLPDNNFRYIYAKASKTNTTASIFITSDKITFDSDPNDYYFLIGILHSVVDGVRVLSITVGTTTISGGLVRTGIISSLDGQTSFNLNTGEIKGKITFSSGSSGYANLTDKPDLSSFEATRDYVNTALQTDLTDLKNRADGVIESWFYSHSPTLGNLPASNWVTNEQKDAHIGDTFTNMQEFIDNVTTPDAGKAWRFVKNETTGEFSWSLIANSDSTKALIEAGKAKDTADAKRRVFVAQPYPPYNIGDLWTQGINGDLMTCKFERLSGSYVATDWEKASKYTDDTAVNNLQIGGRNYYPDGDFSKGINQYAGGNNVKSFSIIPTDFDGNAIPWNGSKCFSIYTETAGDTYAELSSIAKVDAGDYMLSFYYKSAGAINGNSSYLYINDIPYGLAFSITNDSQWHKVELPINISSKSSIQFRMGFFCYAPAWMNVTRIKIEKGNKATDWTPAPEDVDSAISNIQIGGRNLIKKSSELRSSGTGWIIWELAEKIEGTYTIQLWIENSIENGAGLGFGNASGYNGVYFDYPTIKNGIYTKTFTNLNSGANTHLALLVNGSTNIKKAKLEKGNKPTDWSPAPEDVDNRITAEAQKIIALENKTNFLGGTTIDGNVVATGTMLVGNESGTNAGLTGTGDTNTGVYLWGGGTYQQMLQGLAKKEQRRNGVDIWRHPNGQIGFEIGIRDGRLIFNGYHSDGYKLFELDPNRGLIAVSYTQESWTQTPLRKLNYTSSTFNESTIASEINSAIIKNTEYVQFTAPGEEATPDTEYLYMTTYTLLENYVGYDYDNGTNPTNAVYESLKGMKANNGDRNTNIPNGWYLTQLGLIYSESSYNSPPPPYYTFVVYVYYYTNGKITDTRVVTITK